jgi:tRNA 2-selenouridine synthase SelU
MTVTPLYQILPNGEIVLTIDETCIQTTAKRARQQLVEALLADQVAGNGVDKAIELLARFLETADFGRLRANHPELRAGARSRVKLSVSADAAVRWEVVTEG